MVRRATKGEIARADGTLPFDRLDQPGLCSWWIAWDGEEPVGHARLVLDDPPELQNVWVVPAQRRHGVCRALATAAEREARDRGHSRLRVTVSETNLAGQAVWRRLGFVSTGEAPERMQKTIVLRGRPLAIDDTLLALEKRLLAN